MNFNEALSTVESSSFSAQANLASGDEAFSRIVCEHKAVILLLKKLSKSLWHRHLVLSRIRQLAKKDLDPKYCNPWDVALATYLRILNLTDPDLARYGSMVVVQSSNCWWSARTAQCFLAEERSP